MLSKLTRQRVTSPSLCIIERLIEGLIKGMNVLLIGSRSINKNGRLREERRRKIYEFVQGHNEPLDIAWERFKGLIHACPTHNLPMFQLISIFFDAMNERSRTRINDNSNSKFIKMDSDKAWELLDEITTFDA